jgi:hypothetical protein
MKSGHILPLIEGCPAITPKTLAEVSQIKGV